MTEVLFVCTGNVFRSLAAELAVARVLSSDPTFSVSSAGTADRPELEVRGDVLAHLGSHALDASRHRRRQLTEGLLERSDVIIAMSTPHQVEIAERFMREVPLYTACAGVGEVALPDVDELFKPEEFLTEPALAYVRDTIDRIIEMAPAVAAGIMGRQSATRS
ncbi:MAG: hypothetical protein AAF458_23770 [Pseudomonadota bacterium]